MDNIQKKQAPNYTFALIVMFAVMFLIGFITTMNNSMIEFCKEAFGLKDSQGQLVNTAFYGAYALSIPLGMMMNKIGYKKTLLLGLAVVGIGFVINYFGISSLLGMETSVIYSVFLGSMFIVALGIVMLQLVANPYVMVLGSPEKGAFRMTLSNALNSAATTVAPVFITYVIIAGKAKTPDAVPGPYLGRGIFPLILGVGLFVMRVQLCSRVVRYARHFLLFGYRARSAIHVACLFQEQSGIGSLWHSDRLPSLLLGRNDGRQVRGSCYSQ